MQATASQQHCSHGTTLPTSQALRDKIEEALKVYVAKRSVSSRPIQFADSRYMFELSEENGLYNYLIKTGTNMLREVTPDAAEGPHKVARFVAEAVVVIEALCLDDEEIPTTVLEQHLSLDSSRNLVRYFASRIPCNCLDAAKEAYKEKTGHCNHGLCGKSTKDAKLMNCSGCKMIKYCSKECQTMDWKEHKKVCKMIQKQRKKQQQS